MSGQLINKLRKPRPPWRARCSSLITRNIEASDGALVIVVFRRKAMSWLSRHQPDYREAGRGLTQRVIFLGGAELGARRSLALNNGPRMRRVRPVTESAMPWLIVGPVTQVAGFSLISQLGECHAVSTPQFTSPLPGCPKARIGGSSLPPLRRCHADTNMAPQYRHRRTWGR